MGDWCLLCCSCRGLFSRRIWLADGLAGPERDVIRKCGFIYSRDIVGNLRIGFFGGVGFPQGHDGAEPLWARSSRVANPAAAWLNRLHWRGDLSWRMTCKGAGGANGLALAVVQLSRPDQPGQILAGLA